jgi:hypothetical protein
VPAPVSVRGHHLRHRGYGCDFGLVFIERAVAAAAHIIGCTELN